MQTTVSRLKTGKITRLGTKYFSVFWFLTLGLGKPERWMPGMPRAEDRTPLYTLTMEGGSQGVNQRILKLISSKSFCVLGSNIYSTKKHFLRSRKKKRQWKTLIENNTVPLTLPSTKVYFDCILNGDSATDAPNLASTSVFDQHLIASIDL